MQEIFQSQITNERYLFDDVAGYEIDKDLFHKHEQYITGNILCDFDFNLFDYWVSLSGDRIEKLKRSHYDSWPPE